MNLAKFSVKNTVLINLIMLIVFIIGIYTAFIMPKEQFPDVEFGEFLIIVPYPGVSPAEIENLIIDKIEEEITNVDNIEFYSSVASLGSGLIHIVMEPDADLEKAENDIQNELDKVNDLPDEAMDPIFFKINMQEVSPICNIVLGGDFSGNSMREISDNFKEELLQISDISKADVWGTQEREIWIDGDINKLEQYGISLDDITRVIQTRNMNVPGGMIKFGRKEFVIRSIGEFNSTKELEKLAIVMDGNGRAIRLEDVATVKDTLSERTIITKLDNEKSVNINVYKKSAGNIITVIKDIRKFIAEYEARVDGLKISLRNDGSVDVENSITTLSQSALLGVGLVFLSLFMFLGWRNALFAAIGIPFTFLLSFFLMQLFGITMNNLSLFALILVLGMVVDDAIVVIENVHRYVEQGMDIKEAAVRGTNEIMWPVIAAVLTTAVAFLPMLMMEGMMGKFMRVFPIVVSLALLASLFECFIILPSHLADYTRPFSLDKKSDNKRKNLIDFIVKYYQKVLNTTLNHRIISVGFVVIMLILSIAALGGGLIKQEFFPTRTPKTIVLKLKTPIGTHLDVTNNIISKIEKKLLDMSISEDIEAIITNVGMMQNDYQMEEKSSNAEIKIDLKDIDNMKFTHEEIKSEIRDYIGTIPELVSYKFDVIKDGPPTGKDVEIRVKGDDLTQLKYLGTIISDELGKIDGVADIENSFALGKKEVQIIPNHEKLALYGLTVAEIAGYIRTATTGTDISKFKGFGNDEIDVVIRLQKDQIENLDQLKNLKIKTRNGNLLKIKDIAKLEIVNGLSTINHRDGKRIITITADCTEYLSGLDKKDRTPSEVMEVLFGNEMKKTRGSLSSFEQKYPGYLIDIGGVSEEQAKSYQSLFMAFGVAILLIFTILAAQFKSYVQPLIVMLTIPFSFIGVVIGLLVTGLPFSLNTLIAVVALTGIVVNDSLVLVDFVNRERENGVDRRSSLINAGSTRLRPIILTTVTTIFGLLPMIFSASKAAADWKPMAVSIAFGLGFATILTLIVIPVFYSLVDSIFGRLSKERFRS